MAKSDFAHLFVKGFSIQKLPDGSWSITSLSTNHGKFAIGEQENRLLERNLVDRFAGYIVQELKPQIEEFLEEEGEVNGES